MNELLQLHEDWIRKNRVNNELRGKKFIVHLHGMSEEPETMFEEPPFGRNNDGSAIQIPDFTSGI